jgi:polyphosphate kinase 2 (PPK2 family)
MDTAGKGGIVTHVMGAMNPQGVQLKAFKAPTDEEKSYDFLWRIEKEVPAAGMVGVFDRSHYEDVLIHRVYGWASKEELERRYIAINEFEAR